MSRTTRPTDIDDSGHTDTPALRQNAAVRSNRVPVQTLNKKGLKSSKGVVPPDTVGEVGSTHFVQMVNHPFGSQVAVFEKEKGKRKARFILADLAEGLSPECFGAATGDPIPIYDQLADRWLLTEIVSPGFGNLLCVYVSSSSNPITSTWDLYVFQTPGFPDYPKWAMTPDAYYFGVNEGDVSTRAVYVLQRAPMLAGNNTTGIRRTGPRLSGFGFQLFVPVDLEGSDPGASASGLFVRHVDDEAHSGAPNATNDFIEVHEFIPDFTTPANSTFSLLASIPIAEFSSDLCGLTSFFCVPQPKTFQTLDPLREPIMHRPLIRTFGTSQSLVGTFVTDVDGTDHHAVRWFELRRSISPVVGAWSLFQEGTVGTAGDPRHRWMSSIAMNDNGDIALGYSVSSSTVFPSIAITGRLSGDTLGTMPQPETFIVNGKKSQTGADRWGDYSAMSVDPVDGETFWYTNEFSKGKVKWQTQFVEFQLQ